MSYLPEMDFHSFGPPPLPNAFEKRIGGVVDPNNNIIH